MYRSVDLGAHPDSFNLFFGAMAHRQLGDRDEARRCYEKAVAWMDEKKPKDAELIRFRAEARELLGIVVKGGG